MSESHTLPYLPQDALRPELYFEYLHAEGPLFTPTAVKDVFVRAAGSTSSDYSIGQASTTTPAVGRRGSELKITEKKSFDPDDTEAAAKLVVKTSATVAPLLRIGGFRFGEIESDFSGSIKSTISGRSFLAVTAMSDVLFSRGTGVKTLQSKIVVPLTDSFYATKGFLSSVREASAVAKSYGALGLDVAKPSEIVLKGTTPDADIAKQIAFLSKIFDYESVLDALRSVYGADPKNLPDIYHSAMQGTSDPHYAVTSLLGSFEKTSRDPDQVPSL